MPGSPPKLADVTHNSVHPRRERRRERAVRYLTMMKMRNYLASGLVCHAHLRAEMPTLIQEAARPDANSMLKERCREEPGYTRLRLNERRVLAQL
jgi:hypothetical protein